MANSDLHIVQTMPGKDDFRLFLQVPAFLYSSESISLLQTDAIETKYLEACFVVIKNIEPVAIVELFCVKIYS